MLIHHQGQTIRFFRILIPPLSILVAVRSKRATAPMVDAVSRTAPARGRIISNIWAFIRHFRSGDAGHIHHH